MEDINNLNIMKTEHTNAHSDKKFCEQLFVKFSIEEMKCPPDGC